MGSPSTIVRHSKTRAPFDQAAAMSNEPLVHDASSSYGGYTGVAVSIPSYRLLRLLAYIERVLTQTHDVRFIRRGAYE